MRATNSVLTAANLLNLNDRKNRRQNDRVGKPTGHRIGVVQFKRLRPLIQTFLLLNSMERHHCQISTLKRMYQIINSYIFKWAYFQMNERTFERTNVLLN